MLISKLKRRSWKYAIMLSVIMTSLTGCQKAPSTNSFESMLSVDKSVNSVTSEEEINQLVDENTSISSDNIDKGYDNFAERTDAEYYSAMEKLTDNSQEGNGEPLAKQLLVGFYGFYTQIKLYTPLICFVSVLCGIILFIFARGNKAARKFGLFGLVIGLPLCMVFIVYGVGLLNGIFLY